MLVGLGLKHLCKRCERDFENKHVIASARSETSCWCVESVVCCKGTSDGILEFVKLW